MVHQPCSKEKGRFVNSTVTFSTEQVENYLERCFENSWLECQSTELERNNILMSYDFSRPVPDIIAQLTTH